MLNKNQIVDLELMMLTKSQLRKPGWTTEEKALLKEIFDLTVQDFLLVTDGDAATDDDLNKIKEMLDDESR